MSPWGKCRRERWRKNHLPGLLVPTRKPAGYHETKKSWAEREGEKIFLGLEAQAYYTMCNPTPRAHPAALSLTAMEESRSEESSGSNFERGTDTNARPFSSTLAFWAKEP